MVNIVVVLIAMYLLDLYLVGYNWLGSAGALHANTNIYNVCGI